MPACFEVTSRTRCSCLVPGRLLLAGLLVVVILCAVPGDVAWADPVAPSPGDREIAFAVTRLLDRDHLLRHPLNDEISQRTLKTYLKMLDPWKMYFYQSDIDAFKKQENNLDDQARRGDVTFAYAVFNVLLARIDERLRLVDELLATKHDFTVDEDMVIDRDTTAYARDPADAREKWRKRIKYEILSLKAEDTEGQEALQRLSRRYHSFAKRMHQISDDKLLEMYLSAITTSFDPHTSYMSPRTLEDFEIDMRRELEGIGALLESEDGIIVVRDIVPGGAADKDHRLKIKDKILGVAQGPEGEFVDVTDMDIVDAVKLIRGRPGTVVRLKVVSVDNPKPQVLDITRARIELSGAKSQVFEEGMKPDGIPYKLGVIDLPLFYTDMTGARKGVADYKSTTRDVARILEDFKTQGVDAVILDLRGNGGGSLPEAVDLTGLFIDEGPIVQVKDSDGRVRPCPDPTPGTAWDGPLVVLVDKLSASASEILAGAIQDYGRGLIVGDHATHGKGTVQQLMDVGQELFVGLSNVSNYGTLKVTIQQFYRPSGESTQDRGVLSDIEWPSVTTHLDIGEADLDYPIAFDRVKPLDYPKLGYVDPAVCAQLRQRSAQRVANSKDFQEVLREIAIYKQRKDRKTVTLNEKRFLAEEAELNGEKEDLKKTNKMSDQIGSGIKRDFYLDEALAITLDYIRIGHMTRTN